MPNSTPDNGVELKTENERLKQQLATLQQQLLNAEKALAQATSESHIHSAYIGKILNELPIHFYCRDKEGRIVYCNEAQAKNTGFNNIAELMGIVVENISVEAIRMLVLAGGDLNRPEIVNKIHPSHIINIINFF